MTPFPQLDAEQEGLAATLATYDPALDHPTKRRLAEEACRVLTLISQVREEFVYPSCVDRAAAAELDAFVIEGDLMRVLVAEIMASRPSDLLYDGLLAALKAAVRRRWSEEEAPGGLWSGLVDDPSMRALDIEIGARLNELDAASRTGDWTPLLPLGLETLRSSLPPSATRWTDL